VPDHIARAPTVGDIRRVGPRFREADEEGAKHLRRPCKQGGRLRDETGHIGLLLSLDAVLEPLTLGELARDSHRISGP
jgi:hypothetical protein